MMQLVRHPAEQSLSVMNQVSPLVVRKQRRMRFALVSLASTNVFVVCSALVFCALAYQG